MKENEKIIHEGNSFYSIDLNCQREKQKEKKEKAEKNRFDKKQRGRR